MVDLGCGEGRILLEAVDSFGIAGGTGVEGDEAILNQAREACGDHPELTWEQADLMDGTWTPREDATVLTAYLTAHVLASVAFGDLVRTWLDGCQGRRLVTLMYAMPAKGWTPTRVATLGSGGGSIQSYRYDSPAK